MRRRPKALEALAAGQVDAVVYGADVLGYYSGAGPEEALRNPARHVRPPGPRLSAAQSGSPLREPINDALRRYMDQPGWRDLQDRFLGNEPEPDLR